MMEEVECSCGARSSLEKQLKEVENDHNSKTGSDRPS